MAIEIPKGINQDFIEKNNNIKKNEKESNKSEKESNKNDKKNEKEKKKNEKEKNKDDKKNASKESNNKLVSYGREVLEAKTDEEKSIFGVESSNLELLFFLGAGCQMKPKSRKGLSATGNNESLSYKVPTIVAGVFKSKKDLYVPRIDITITPTTGIDPEKDVDWELVKAGDSFDMNMMESMMLLIQDKYLGFCSYQGQPDAVRLSFHSTKYFKGEQKLPTPHFKEKSSSGILSNYKLIDAQDPETGIWSIKDEYKERYGKYLERLIVQREANKSSTLNHVSYVALGIQKILGVKGEFKPTSDNTEIKK